MFWALASPMLISFLIRWPVSRTYYISSIFRIIIYNNNLFTCLHNVETNLESTSISGLYVTIIAAISIFNTIHLYKLKIPRTIFSFFKSFIGKFNAVILHISPKKMCHALIKSVTLGILVKSNNIPVLFSSTTSGNELVLFGQYW